jgi:O-succinylbenzoic acid--CoA ligase
VLIGGGPVPVTLLGQARRLGAPVLQTYGLTEACSQVCTERPGDADGLTAGPPVRGTSVRIVDGHGQPLPPGGVGEIEVQGPTVMRGYFRDEEATRGALVDGWLRTRDLGTLDERGRLRVFSRRTDLILSGGENVYPAEVEAVLFQHPALVEAAVLGLEDPVWGQKVAAAVVLRSDVPDADLERFCRERLAGYKVPRWFLRVDALPRNATGKVDRTALRQQFGYLPPSQIP